MSHAISQIPDEERAKQIAEIQARFDAWLMAFPNVVGTGIGYRRIAGSPTGELCLVALVRRKIPAKQLAADAVLPRELEGIAIDVVESGDFSI